MQAGTILLSNLPGYGDLCSSSKPSSALWTRGSHPGLSIRALSALRGPEIMVGVQPEAPRCAARMRVWARLQTLVSVQKTRLQAPPPLRATRLSPPDRSAWLPVATGLCAASPSAVSGCLWQPQSQKQACTQFTWGRHWAMLGCCQFLTSYGTQIGLESTKCLHSLHKARHLSETTIRFIFHLHILRGLQQQNHFGQTCLVNFFFLE